MGECCGWMMLMCVDNGRLWGKCCTESCEAEELYAAIVAAAESYCYRLHHNYC